MKKKIFSAVFLFFTAVVLCGAEVTVAEWDFTKNNLFNNKFPILVNGRAKITPAGLNVPVSMPKIRTGAVTNKVYPALTPDGAFSVSIDFTLSSKEKRAQKTHVLVDCKYQPATNAKQAAFNYGYMITLRHVRANIFVPSVAFGYQKHTAVINGKALAIPFDKLHNLRLVYNAKGAVTLVLNKRNIASGRVQTGKVFPAKLPLSFGARGRDDFWPLGGTIRKVTIRKTVIPPKTYRPGTTIASWSFVNANVTKGKFPVKMRGGRITPAGMVVANKNPNIPCGAVGVKPNPDLTPQQSFEVNAELILNNTGKQMRTNPAMIFDMKHTPLTNNKGYMFYLEPQPGNGFRMVGAFGFGTHSVRVKSIEFRPPYGKLIRVGMRFSTLGHIIFFYNGAELSSATVTPGKLAVADIAPAFGDRAGKLYWPLIGTLKSVRIIAR